MRSHGRKPKRFCLNILETHTDILHSSIKGTVVLPTTVQESRAFDTYAKPEPAVKCSQQRQGFCLGKWSLGEPNARHGLGLMDPEELLSAFHSGKTALLPDCQVLTQILMEVTLLLSSPLPSPITAPHQVFNSMFLHTGYVERIYHTLMTQGENIKRLRFKRY